MTTDSVIAVATAQRFTPANFKAYGAAISVEGLKDTAKTQRANQGSAFKLVQVAEMTNQYPKGDGRTMWDIFQSRYTPDKWDQDKKHYMAKVLERHPYTSQTFIPMGISGDKDAYVVICAPNGANDKPDVSKIEMFVAKGNEAVMYNAGVWHAPMVTLVDKIDFCVLTNQNGVPEENCEEVFYDEGITLALH